MSKMNINLKAIKIFLICGFGTAILFGLSSLVFYYGDWQRLFFVALLGLFIGFIAAPELEPKYFKYTWAIQLFSGFFAGLAIGWLFQLESEAAVLAVMISGFIGWLAPYWMKHMPMP